MMKRIPGNKEAGGGPFTPRWDVRSWPALAALMCIVILMGLLAGRVVAAPASSVPSADNSQCLSCHSQPNKILRIGINTILLTMDAAKFKESIHGQNQLACTDCHVDISEFPHPDYSATNRREFQFALYESTRQGCVKCHEGQTNDAMTGVHEQTLEIGNHNAALCADCHNPHYVEPAADLNREEIPDVCARCHSEIAATYKKSVHGEALLAESNPDVPNCVSCHGNHAIKDPRTVEFRNNTPLLCAQCHTNPDIMDKYEISTDVLDTYVSDYHGTTVALFEQTSPDLPTNKPVCTDCHGIHDISKPDDPQTGIGLKENLLVKCQRCHPGASANFPDAWMSHYIPSPDKYPLVFFVTLFYQLMIPGVIGGMLIFVASDIIRRLVNRWKGGAH
ncbi:MAG: cytochrome c3 family protein [Chloroflexota bacterium]